MKKSIKSAKRPRTTKVLYAELPVQLHNAYAAKLKLHGKTIKGDLEEHARKVATS